MSSLTSAMESQARAQSGRCPLHRTVARDVQAPPPTAGRDCVDQTDREEAGLGNLSGCDTLADFAEVQVLRLWVYS